ncbi:hypothetical protein [Falsiroseomonas tokyonensis]|uniref:AsmA-like C-terminal domain-containing protein n=1 Tax=Falsiroseomonas tokyonensis TaxID=430521 RepID=A0ABV7BRZ9_9PROT|nr:hypothetical protein [Falsiroseomonas tokyonensis]MBU8537806.1 hypothetical protein [Falsiroseomonas tokyonensis]
MRRRPAMFILTGVFTGALALAGAGALAQAEAERQLDAALERLRAAFGPEARLAVGSREVDPVTGRARLGDLTITAPRERIAVTELVVQDVTATRLGRAEARSVLLVTNIGASEDRFEAARLVLGGMSLPAEGARLDPATFELGTLELEALRGTSSEGSLTLARATAQGYGPGVLGAATVEGLDFQGGGKAANAFSLGRAAVQSMVLPPLDGSMPDVRQFSVQSMTLEGARLRDPDKQVDVTIGRFALRDWVPGRLTDAALEGVQVAAPFGAMGPGNLRMGRVALQGIDMATSVAAVMEEKQVPDPVPGTPQRIVVEGLSAEAGGQPVFALGRTALEASMDPGGLAMTSMDLQGLRIVPPAGSAGWLEGLGYREITGGSALRATGRREGGMMEVDPFTLTWDQAATLGLSANLTGVPLPQPGEPTESEAYMAQFMQARLHGLTLTLRDHGLVGRLIAQQARNQRVPEDRLREQLAQMALAMPVPGEAPPARPGTAPAPARKGAPAAAAPAPQADPFLPVRQALASFIRQPRELEFTLRPPQPISLQEMSEISGAGPAETARRLGLGAVAR